MKHHNLWRKNGKANTETGGESDRADFVNETNALYTQLQNPSISLRRYSNALNEYKYLIEDIEHRSDFNFYHYELSEIGDIQATINAFDYLPLIQEKAMAGEATVEAQQSVAYSLVCIKNGQAVLKDVIINDVAAKDLHLEENLAE